MIDVTNFLYTILGGTSVMAVTKLSGQLHNQITGRNDIFMYSTAIKRHARHHVEVEKLLYENENLNSIVMQVIDAAYIAVKGKEPAIAVLHLHKREDAHLFRNCLPHIDDPEAVYALATRKRPLAEECSECVEFSNSRPENTWFRSSKGRDITDEKVDEAMLGQAIALAKSRDRNISQSGACHIAVKTRKDNKDNIIVLPTSVDFRKSFKKEYGTDDLAQFGAEDLFDKILNVRRKMHKA